MQRVTRSTAIATQPPPPGSPGAPGFFTGGDPGGGVPATIPGYEWFNSVQEEIAGIVLRAGLALDAADQAQLRKALDRLHGGGLRSVTANTTLTADDAGLVLVNAAGGNVTITLPAAAAANGRPLRLVLARTDTAATTVTIQRAGSDTIEGATTYSIAAGERVSLISDGATAWRLQSGAGRLIGVQVFGTAGTATYTPTPGTTSVVVQAVGGGGGGGGAVIAGAGNCAAGLPGNAGAFGLGRYTSGFAGVTVTVGAGGTGGTGAAGGNGGTSSFGALLSCPGGPGGGPGAAQAGSASGANGNPSGLPSGANVAGAVGGLGGPTFGQSTGQIGVAGFGGPSHYGAGGVPASANLNGGSAQTPGAGGAGTFGQTNSAALTGGNGAAGRVIVWEYA